MSEFQLPKEVEDAASMAEELHARIYPQEAPKDETPEEPKQEEQPEEPPQGEPEENDESYKAQAKLFKSRLDSLSGQYRELKQTLAQYQAAPKDEPKEESKANQIDEILAKLKTEYPDELIENLRLLNRLEAEETTKKFLQPVQEQVTKSEENQKDVARTNYVDHLTKVAPNWEKIWTVASELQAGEEVSDPKVAEFLLSEDPSGLYTNLDLLDQYNDKWDADRFAKVCNLYQAKTEPQKQANPAREALLAPSRSNSQSTPAPNDKKLWTLAEFEQFQRDDRAGKYDEATSAALWADVQRAPHEGRFSG